MKAVWHADGSVPDLVASTGFAVLTPESPTVPGFVGYLCQSDPFTERVTRESSGVSYPAIAETKLGLLEAAVPPPSEQGTIADFLDCETARIDRLVAKQEELIQLLREKRTALISHVMARGLDPNVPMRDSGVEWLGEIPARWEVRRLKNWVRLNARVLPENTPPEYEFEYVDIGSVGTGNLFTRPERIRFAAAPSRARRVVRGGDTIVSTVRTYLKAVWHADGSVQDLVASTGFAVLTPESPTVPGFVGYFCQSDPFTERVTRESSGVSYPAIAETKLGLLEVAVPSPSEQRAITGFLDRETANIDELVAKVNEAINCLDVYRAALISAAVTGKIDVRIHQENEIAPEAQSEGTGP